MKVKKKNSAWSPSENPRLAVGETIEISDPKALILNGDVVAIGENGEEISAYELYGVIVSDERKEFEEYLKMKRQEALNAKLLAEQEALAAKLKEQTPAVETVKEETVKEEAPKVTTPVKEAKKK